MDPFSLMSVENDGAVRLGEDVSCDGFLESCGTRVQTHVHLDHMSKFNRSKSRQDIICSPATRELLIAEYNADLAYRINIIGLQAKQMRQVSDGFVQLLDSGHMLGAVQV